MFFFETQKAQKYTKGFSQKFFFSEIQKVLDGFFLKHKRHKRVFTKGFFSEIQKMLDGYFLKHKRHESTQKGFHKSLKFL